MKKRILSGPPKPQGKDGGNSYLSLSTQKWKWKTNITPSSFVPQEAPRYPFHLRDLSDDVVALAEEREPLIQYVLLLVSQILPLGLRVFLLGARQRKRPGSVFAGEDCKVHLVSPGISQSQKIIRIKMLRNVSFYIDVAMRNQATKAHVGSVGLRKDISLYITKQKTEICIKSMDCRGDKWGEKEMHK